MMTKEERDHLRWVVEFNQAAIGFARVVALLDDLDDLDEQLHAIHAKGSLSGLTPAQRWAGYQPPRLPEADRIDAALESLAQMTPEQVIEAGARTGEHAGIRQPEGVLKRVTFTLACPFCENRSTHPLTLSVMAQSPEAILRQLKHYAAHHAACASHEHDDPAHR